MNAEDLPTERTILALTPPVQSTDGRDAVFEPCHWCPRDRPEPATHAGLCGDRVLVTGCHWHMRLWRQRGELRAIQGPAPKPRRRR